MDVPRYECYPSVPCAACERIAQKKEEEKKKEEKKTSRAKHKQTASHILQCYEAQSRCSNQLSKVRSTGLSQGPLLPLVHSKLVNDAPFQLRGFDHVERRLQDLLCRGLLPTVHQASHKLPAQSHPRNTHARRQPTKRVFVVYVRVKGRKWVVRGIAYELLRRKVTGRRRGKSLRGCTRVGTQRTHKAEAVLSGLAPAQRGRPCTVFSV